MSLFDNFIRACAEDCVNARRYNGEEREHDCYCECEECIPPRPLSQFDRVREAKYAMDTAFRQAKGQARALFEPRTDHWARISRQLAWQHFREALSCP